MPACDTDPDDRPTLTDETREMIRQCSDEALAYFDPPEFNITSIAQRVVLCESVLEGNPRSLEVDGLMAGTISTTLAIWEEMLPGMARVDRIRLARWIASKGDPITVSWA
jgi:hypothetical protein